jgi:hypothetical protein
MHRKVHVRFGECGYVDLALSSGGHEATWPGDSTPQVAGSSPAAPATPMPSPAPEGTFSLGRSFIPSGSNPADGRAVCAIAPGIANVIS